MGGISRNATRRVAERIGAAAIVAAVTITTGMTSQVTAAPVASCDGRDATIVGTGGDDTLIGTDGPDVIVGLGGNDKIRGNGGDDVICGGEGRDDINGGDGDDRIFGEGGRDTLHGGDGDDLVDGGAGNDAVKGGDGDDLLIGGPGRDRVKGGDGFDTCDNEARRSSQCENFSPAAVDDEYTTDEDSVLLVAAPGVLGNDTDPDGQPLTVTAVDSTATIGLVSVAPDGSVDYDPDGQFEDLDDGDTAVDGFSYEISDGLGGVAAATVTIEITGVTDNFPPVVDDQSFAVDENSPGGTAVGSIAFTDPDLGSGDVVSFSVTGGTGTTAFDVSASGEITVADSTQLDHETTSSFTLGVVATDAAGESDTATITIDVNDVNEAPVAVNDGFEIDENGTVSEDLTSNDSDPDGDALAVSAISHGGGSGTVDGTPFDVTSSGGRTAVVTATDVSFTLSPGGNFADLALGETDTVQLTYTVTDPSGLIDTADVTVTLNGTIDDDDGDGVEIGVDNCPTIANPDQLDRYGSDAGDACEDLDGDGILDVDETDFCLNVDGVTVEQRGSAECINNGFTTTSTAVVNGASRVSYGYTNGTTITIIGDGNFVGAGDGENITVFIRGDNSTADVHWSDNTGQVFGDNGHVRIDRYVERSTAISYGDCSVEIIGSFPDIEYDLFEICPAPNQPEAADFGVAAIGNTQLRAGTGETAPVSPPAKIVTNNLVTASTNAVSATAATGQATTQGGTVDINADGSFVYTPPTGFVGDDTFTYEIVNADALTDAGVVTVTVADLVWYVSSAGGFGSSGRSHDPFGAEEVDRAGTGDTVYFFPSATSYDTDGDQPTTGQSWIGAGVPLVIDGVTLANAATAPDLSQLSAISSADVTLRGLNVAGLASFGGAHRLTIDDVALTRYLIINDSTDVSIDIDSFVDIGGGAVRITNVTGTTTFGSFNASTAGGGPLAYLQLLNAGTVTINGTTNTINGPNLPAVNIDSTTVRGSGTNNSMAFQSVTGTSISLQNTDGFEITGTAGDTACGGTTVSTCSGGTVGSVSITGSSGVSLNKLKVLNSPGDGVTVTDSSNVSIVDSEIVGAGDANEEHGVHVSGHTGTFTVQGSLITGFRDTGVQVDQSSGTSTVSIEGTTIEDNHEIVNGGDGEHGVEVRTTGTADVTVNVMNSRFLDLEVSAVNIVNESASATIDANVVGNSVFGLGGVDDFPTSPAINLVQDDLGTLTFDIQSNLIESIPGNGIDVSGDGTITGRIGGPAALDGNTVSGDSSSLGDGIQLDFSGESAAADFTATVVVQNNLVQNVGDDGMQVLHRDNLGTLNLTVEGNRFNNVGSEGFRFFADNDLGGVSADPQSNVRFVDNDFFNVPATEEVIYFSSGDTASTCAHISGNTGFNGAPADEIALLLSGAATMQITQASVAALVAANGGAAVTADAGVSFNGGCTNPPLPSNP